MTRYHCILLGPDTDFLMTCIGFSFFSVRLLLVTRSSCWPLFLQRHVLIWFEMSLHFIRERSTRKILSLWNLWNRFALKCKLNWGFFLWEYQGGKVTCGLIQLGGKCCRCYCQFWRGVVLGMSGSVSCTSCSPCDPLPPCSTLFHLAGSRGRGRRGALPCGCQPLIQSIRRYQTTIQPLTRWPGDQGNSH